jgi:hypothetical protein
MMDHSQKTIKTTLRFLKKQRKCKPSSEYHIPSITRAAIKAEADEAFNTTNTSNNIPEVAFPFCETPSSSTTYHIAHQPAPLYHHADNFPCF